MTADNIQAQCTLLDCATQVPDNNGCEVMFVADPDPSDETEDSCVIALTFEYAEVAHKFVDGIHQRESDDINGVDFRLLKLRQKTIGEQPGLLFP